MFSEMAEDGKDCQTNESEALPRVVQLVKMKNQDVRCEEAGSMIISSYWISNYTVTQDISASEVAECSSVSEIQWRPTSAASESQCQQQRTHNK